MYEKTIRQFVTNRVWRFYTTVMARRTHSGVRDEVFLKSSEVAEALGISRPTLHVWIRKGRVPKPDVDPSNGYYRWSLKDLDVLRRELEDNRP